MRYKQEAEMRVFVDFSGFIGKDIELRGKKGKVLAVIVKTDETDPAFKITFILQGSKEGELGYKATAVTVFLEDFQNEKISIID